MSRYARSLVIKDENGKRRANTVIIPTPIPSASDIYIEITSPERLDLLAYQFYGDASLWWIIANANGLGKGSFFTPEGVTIRIPNSDNIQNQIQKRNDDR
tara:strand:+ start:297 stop:596 length:300 start_codon:yes stop_codon:yes gene_type:complete